MRSRDEVALVMGLVGDGLNDCEIARGTGIPRSTIQYWRRNPHLIDECARRGPGCGVGHEFDLLPVKEYSYLLGVYLGDGCISAAARPGVWRLRLAMDAAAIVEEASKAMEAVLPGKRAHQYQRPGTGYVEISMYWKHWPCLFPHRPGRKHLRAIVLTRWQEGIVGQARQACIRGLIHSDGCRVIANDRGVKSVRYLFSNRSEDIKRIFCENLDALGIPWTRPCSREIAIYRRAAVEKLDAFVGPKR